MTYRVLFTLILAAGLGQSARADDVSLRPLEEQLAGVLRWEILWNDSPKGFQSPSGGSARVALYSTSDSLSYCSHDLGVCARYVINPQRNWEGAASGRCEGSQSDEDALLAFDGVPTRLPPTGTQPRITPRGGGGFDGKLGDKPGILWTAAINLGSRGETVRQYSQMHPQEIDGLQKWIQASMTKDAGVKSITVACFAPTDPMVYYYVDRPEKGPILMDVFWNRERQQWVVASSLERPQGAEKLEEMHRIIESIACSKMSFE
jgi:hypothetical protein